MTRYTMTTTSGTPSVAAPPVHLAIIGFSGLIGARHLAHAAANPSIRLVALVDPSPSAPAVLAAQHFPNNNDGPIPHFDSVTSLLSAAPSLPRLDAAIICTPNHTHVPVALQLLDHDYPGGTGLRALLVEKPISNSVASARTLLQRAEEKKVKILVGHHRRFNPYVIAAKKVLDDDQQQQSPIGSITAVSALWTTLKPPAYFQGPNAWRADSGKGGGVVLINLIHEVDLLRHFLGPITAIHAERTLPRRQHQQQGQDQSQGAEEGAALTMRFASGAVGTFILSDAVASPHFFESGTGENPHLPVSTRDGGERIDVYRFFGTRGTLSVPDMTLWRYPSDDDRGKDWGSAMTPTKVPIDDDPRAPLERQLDHLVDVVRGVVVGEPVCSGVDGLEALVVCEAVREAIGMGSGTVTIGG